MNSAQKVIQGLVDKGWHVKLLTDQSGPKPEWRVWLSWRRGGLPHQEGCQRCATLTEAAKWLETTAKAWTF